MKVFVLCGRAIAETPVIADLKGMTGSHGGYGGTFEGTPSYGHRTFFLLGAVVVRAGSLRLSL
jgi:hypothetical protein